VAVLRSRGLARGLCLTGLPTIAVATAGGAGGSEAAASEAGAEAPQRSELGMASPELTPDEASKYRLWWYGAIDDDKVWVRAIAVDGGGCESLTGKAWIRMDSTRPSVDNIRP
jgi:hypothetical protein